MSTPQSTTYKRSTVDLLPPTFKDVNIHGDPPGDNGYTNHGYDSMEMSPHKDGLSKLSNGEEHAYNKLVEKRNTANGTLSADGNDLPPPYESPGASKDGQSLSAASKDEDGEKKDDGPPERVGVFEVFRFADTKDKMLIAVGIICSMIHGAAFPLMIIVFGNMSDLFVYQEYYENWLDYYWDNITTLYGNVSKQDLIDDPTIVIDELRRLNATDMADNLEDKLTDDFMAQMREYALIYAVIGFFVWVFAYLQVTCWQISSYRQAQRVRTMLFKSILKQEIGWFDTHEVGELNTRLSDDVNKIQDGIGEKLGLFLQLFAQFLAGFVVGFVYGWQLTCVILAVSPLLGISAAIMAKLGASLSSREFKAYAKAGAVAEEVLGSIRTVVAFGGQSKEAARYTHNLSGARDFGVRKGLVNGSVVGCIFFFVFSTYALAFWYGSQLFLYHDYSPGDILVVFFSVLTGAFALGNAAPNMEYFANARGAAHAIYHIIDLVPAIDSSSEIGITPENIKGNIEFRHVQFQYPSRPEVPVLTDFNLSVNVGETMALVGSSGCGKSTTVQLLQRFYDPTEGQVLIDGHDIRDYHLKWLRQHIGVVSQEPVLFQTTIEENIRYGRDGVTFEEIVKAGKMANAHDFITKLPKKYNTLVGERGAQLSGGQKQRIAIARALVRDPKILLLDEATSALDTESEALVQSALDKAREGRTTIVIAHRLSTVRTANKIAGVDNGKVSELGTHEELMKIGGIYYTLCTNQSQKKGEDDDEIEIEYPSSPTKSGHEFFRSFSVQSSGSAGEKARGRTISTSSVKGVKRMTSAVSEQSEPEEDLPDPSLTRLMQMNSAELPFVVIGCLGAMVVGGVQPAFAIIFAEILGSFSELDKDEFESQAQFYSLMFLALGIIAGLSMFAMSSSFARSGANLTMRVREQMFHAYLRQDVSFYDNPKHNTGSLCSTLATEASAINGASGTQLATVLQAAFSILIALSIGFYYSWPLTLLLLAFGPVMFLSGFLQMRAMQGNSKTDKTPMEEAGKIAIEAIENMRTVATLTKENKFYEDYEKNTQIPTNKNVKRSHIQGMTFGLSQGVVFFAYAACFSLGAWLVTNYGLVYEDMFKVIMAVAMTAMSIGRFSSFAPDYGKAKTALARFFVLIDREPSIDSASQEGNKLPSTDGKVTLSNVSFHYPTRPDIPVLQGISLEVLQGKTVALVGSSGCGKSTIVQMVERFYDPLQGSVNIDNNDIRNLHIQWMRSQMGIVSQEPVLFDCSISDNIAYGDNSRHVPMDEIITAAKNANIHNFIQTLPNGYDTNVGDKGTQLSGGQKQRVAIARALIRNPKILLLDEATSALDTESEKIVQEALDKAQEGRTSIVIAHRLSTIQNADCILVIRNGQVTESGTHSQLLQKRGFYYKLNNAQLKKH